MASGSSSTTGNEVNARFAAAALCETHWFACQNVEALSNGRINDSYCVSRVSDGQRFVLQRLSSSVFPNGAELMQQTSRVVSHLQAQHPGWVPELQWSIAGEPCASEVDGMGRVQVWRLWQFVERAKVRERLDSLTQLRNAGAAFGYTHTLLADLPGKPLQDPIPHLFDLAEHYNSLETLTGQQTLSADVQRCIDLLETLRDQVRGFSDRNSIIHGDCKPQNLMFRERSDEVACVLDLDTVMRGNWAWDFGDLVRSIALKDGRFSLRRYVPVLRGFAQASPRDHSGDAEQFSGAPAYVACCLGLRYLNDHLSGDVQFKVQRHGDNLRRAQARLQLAQQLCDERSAMEAAARQALQ